MNERRRWTLWLTLLALAAGLFTWGGDGPEPSMTVVEPAPRASTAAGTARRPREEASELLALRPRPAPVAEPVTDAFRAGTWTPPPKPAPPVKPPPPVAPPFPYRFIGKAQTGTDWVVFLVRQEQTVVAHANDALDGNFRVDEIRPPSMSVTYVPLNLKQTISIGEAY